MAVNNRTDEQIANDVRDTLAWDIRIDDSNIGISVSDGVVTLSGTVGTFSEKVVASEDAWKIKGVRKVIDNLAVRPIGLRTDSDIVADIINALKWDNRVDAKGIVVNVSGGVVELSGMAGSLSEKRAAEEDAWFTAGVVDVVNNISVAPERVRPDAEIVQDVRAALARDVRITDASRISVESISGKVYLRGAVESAQERAAAEEDARFTAGVVDVVNELAVVPLAA